MLRGIFSWLAVLLMAGGIGMASAQEAQAKKIVLIAGKKSHGPGDHEYEKAMRLLAHGLRTASNLNGYKTEVHLYGWPEDEKTLDDADAIVLYSDGSDHNEAHHPLYIGNRFEVIAKQMRRGCGLVLIHYATFASVKRGGPEYLEWVGGHFDYETGNAPNRWASAIKFCDAKTTFPTPKHPIVRGVTMPKLYDEFYYKMRFRENDSRLKPIVHAEIPGEAEPQTIAWAVERTDGGRGFATTIGHPYANFKNDAVRKMLLNAIVWAAKGNVPAEGVASILPQDKDIDSIRALILTGHHHPAHDWKATTAALQEILAKDNRFEVTIWDDPERLASDELSQYHLLIHNYCNWERPTLSQKARTNLLRYIRGGGGLALIHFANGAWRDWEEYFGGLSRRVWIDNKSNHDPYGAFKVQIAKPNHLLTQGLTDFDTLDELYCSQQGDRPVDPLLTAVSKVTGKAEPLAYVYTEAEGRIFQTLLGHAAESVRTPAHAEIIRRACAWLAKREVLPQPVRPVSVSAPPTPGTAPMKLVGGKFGSALDPRGSTVTASRPAEFRPPVTVECWAKLNGKAGYNILIASHLKESRRHWEIFSDAGTGRFCAYLPGYSPSRIDSPADIADGKWKYLAFQWHPNRVLLFVDGKVVHEQEIEPLPADNSAPGGSLWFGSYPLGNLGCDGLIDDVRISNYARPIQANPVAPVVLDRDTIGLWRFDTIVQGFAQDESSRANPVGTNVPAVQTNLPKTTHTRSTEPIPTVDRQKSTNWVSVGNDAGGMRYSQLKQINRTNVKRLKPVWVYNTGDHDPKGGTTIECTPLVIDGVMYLTTVRMNVVALNAATGKELWRFDPKAGGVNRGVAYWSDNKPNGKRRILVSFQNGFLYSLDAHSGKLDTEFGEGGILDLRIGMDTDISRFGYGSSSAPAIYQDIVILGFVSSEVGPGAPGDVRAFDVHSGKQVWRFRTVPHPGEPGYETWTPNAYHERGGANPWSGFTVDTKNGIVFCGTGSAASDFYGADRIGNNLYANCTLALDAKTGKRIWHFQTLRHDIWDRDVPCPPVMVTVKRDGKRIEAVAQVTKTGYCYLFERKTGKPLFPIEDRPVPASDIPGEQAAATQPFPTMPPPFARQEFYDADASDITPETKAYVLGKLQTYRKGNGYNPGSLEGSVITPGFHGGATWSGASFDPTSGLLYVNSNNTPYVLTLVKDPTLGYNFTGYNYFNDQNGYPAIKPPWGLLTAIDLNKGTFAWQVTLGEIPELVAKGIRNTGSENFGGTIVTAGGLVFIGGTKDEKFHAFDSKTGKLLWEYALPAGGYATPATYQINGKQYVVIACGGGGKLRTKTGDAYIAFALE